jgi:hypothetical protein
MQRKFNPACCMSVAAAAAIGSLAAQGHLVSAWQQQHGSNLVTAFGTP